MSDAPFSIDLTRLKSVGKRTDERTVAAADATAADHGFVARTSPTGRRGRQPSPRTGQVHAKVLPHVSDAIANEAQRRGVTQGVIIEEAWELYLNRIDE
ncbi:chromosome partitioning protein ParB [Sphingomonas sp. BK235]|uniref:chromosome partitioning protein ParB n=1 Tax=Sphingomonas sp. BK235 TaxID=2512131 RepID=UPI0010524776|nr:chromosome partitioning protein ParB [Sphingomonas sp. BK235]TCP32402.1 hypothetical protein EV292_10834 [Sphingomonas sp. BK235]